MTKPEINKLCKTCKQACKQEAQYTIVSCKKYQKKGKP